MLFEDLNLVAAGAGCEIVLKPEREMAVKAFLKGRDVLAVLPTGYGPRKKRFCYCQRRFQIALHRFTREFQGGVNIPLQEWTGLLRTINRKKKP